MNLNKNPSSEELRTLLDACEEGDGIQVLMGGNVLVKFRWH